MKEATRGKVADKSDKFSDKTKKVPTAATASGKRTSGGKKERPVSSTNDLLTVFMESEKSAREAQVCHDKREARRKRGRSKERSNQMMQFLANIAAKVLE